MCALTHIERLDDCFGDSLVRVVCVCGARREIEPEALARLVGWKVNSGIRERYEMERAAHPDTRCHRVHVALDDSDMNWIAATIEALEEPAAADATEATGRIARSSFGNVN